jgi:hypothetical protein
MDKLCIIIGASLISYGGGQVGPLVIMHREFTVPRISTPGIIACNMIVHVMVFGCQAVAFHSLFSFCLYIYCCIFGSIRLTR